MSRPVIGLCTALEHARWSVWDQEAVLLPNYNVRTALAMFVAQQVETLAVVSDLDSRRIVGFLTEAYGLRRYNQALEEAQMFPADYDGIVAGSPGLDWSARSAQAVRVASVHLLERGGQDERQSRADQRVVVPAPLHREGAQEHPPAHARAERRHRAHATSAPAAAPARKSG